MSDFMSIHYLDCIKVGIFVKTFKPKERSYVKLFLTPLINKEDIAQVE